MYISFECPHDDVDENKINARLHHRWVGSKAPNILHLYGSFQFSEFLLPIKLPGNKPDLLSAGPEPFSFLLDLSSASIAPSDPMEIKSTNTQVMLSYLRKPPPTRPNAVLLRAFNGSANLGSCPKGDAESKTAPLSCPDQAAPTPPRPETSIPPSGRVNPSSTSSAKPNLKPVSAPRPAVVHDTQAHLELNVDPPIATAPSLSLAGAPAAASVPESISQHSNSTAFETLSKMMQQLLTPSLGLPPAPNVQQIALPATANVTNLQNACSDALSRSPQPGVQPQQTDKRTALDQPGSTRPKKRRKTKSSEGKASKLFLEKSESSQLHPGLPPGHAAFDQLAARKKHSTAAPCMLCMEPIFDKADWSHCVKRQCRVCYHMKCLETFRTAVGQPKLKCPKCSYCLLCKEPWAGKIEVVYCSDEFGCGAELHRKCCSLPDDTCPRCFLVRSLH